VKRAEPERLVFSTRGGTPISPNNVLLSVDLSGLRGPEASDLPDLPPHLLVLVA
jgi:hypothetical protein